MGCPGDLAQQGVVIVASVAQVFTEKLSRQNWKSFLKLHIGEIVGKLKNKKVSSCIFILLLFFRKFPLWFEKVFWICFTTPSGYHFHDFLGFGHTNPYLSILGRQT